MRIPLAVLCCVVFVPAGIAGGIAFSRAAMPGDAFAAGWFSGREETRLRGAMTAGERADYNAALGALVAADPDSLLYLLDTDVLALLREPDLTRREGAVSVWQYRAGSCILDLYFDKGGRGTVSHYEVRERRAARAQADGRREAADSGACLAAIRGERA